MRRNTLSPVPCSLILIAWIITAGFVHAQDARHDPGESESRGPRSGTLVLHGGGNEGDQETDESLPLIKRLAREAFPENDALNIVIIPTAKPEFKNSFLERVFLFGKAAAGIGVDGKTNLKILHTRDRKIANSESFCAPLREAHLVMIPGGLTRLLREAYAETRFVDELWRVLDRGGVIAGGSAGAIIQGAVFSRPTPGRQAFGLISNSVIDVHVTERGRRNYLVNKFKDRTFDKERFLGIGIDENMTAVISQDTLEVFGEGSVFIVNPREWSQGEEPGYRTLSDGDRYDLRKREVLPSTSSAEEGDRSGFSSTVMILEQ